MKKVKNILVGIDMAERSNKVLKRALIIAKEDDAQLIIVHAVRTPWLAVPSYFGATDIAVDTKAIVKKIDKKIKALNTDKISYSIVVKEGEVDDILLYESKMLKADLIIIGAHSKKNNKKSILGTTAQMVAYQSHLPVLIVKKSVKEAYKTIVAPTDFQKESKKSILFAKNIFPSAKFSLLNAFETLYLIEDPYTYTISGNNYLEFYKIAKTESKREMEKFKKTVGIKNAKVIDGELDSKLELVKYINKNNYDLTVVGSGGNRVMKVLLGSVANYLLREVKNDILVYVPQSK